MIDTLEAAKARTFGTIHKHSNYFREYDFNFSQLEGKENLRILEIGVQGGGSLAMWQKCFPTAKITGMDIDPSCKQFEAEGVKIYIGSQEDNALLRRISAEAGPFDVIIDDAGHTMRQQIGGFQTLFPLLREDGVYVIEDLHTSYWSKFGGKKNRRYTAIGYLKDMMDTLHFQSFRSPRVNIAYRAWNKVRPFTFKPKNVFEASIRSMYIATGIAFVHKQGAEALSTNAYRF